MNIKNLKLEFFYLRKALFEHHKFWKYIYNKYVLALKILKLNKIFEKPINNDNLSIHILTCHKDVIMTLWSLSSFYEKSELSGELYLHDDGSLNEKDKNIFKRFFPNAKILGIDEIKKGNYLQNYTIMKKFRLESKKYFLLKKIIDTYFLSDKNIHLIIDSDLIWFEKSQELIQEIEKGCENSLMMSNNNFSFVHFKNTEKLNEEKASYNSGIVLYKKENFDLAKLEEYLEKIDEENKESVHFIEQAGFAVCLKNLKKLDEKKYIIKETVDNETIVKHYTSPRRPLFYIEGINRIVKLLNCYFCHSDQSE
jgi:hypothetical protein